MNSNVEMSIKEMLQKGLTEEEMVNMLKDQIHDAKKALAAEIKSQAKVDETRRAAIKACYDHEVALGLIEDNFTDEDFEKMCDFVKEAEKSLQGYSDLLRIFMGANTSTKEEPKSKTKTKIKAKIEHDPLNADDIIKDFLAGLD